MLCPTLSLSQTRSNSVSVVRGLNITRALNLEVDLVCIPLQIYSPFIARLYFYCFPRAPQPRVGLIPSLNSTSPALWGKRSMLRTIRCIFSLSPLQVMQGVLTSTVLARGFNLNLRNLLYTNTPSNLARVEVTFPSNNRS